jgi:hypothetical protein
MRLFISGVAVIVLAVALLAACNSNDGQMASKDKLTNNNSATAEAVQTDGVRRITVAELKAAADKGTVHIVDVRTADAYAVEHIKGSVNIPEGAIESRAGELPTDKMIVTYCS